jgi:hypothetical protein
VRCTFRVFVVPVFATHISGAIPLWQLSSLIDELTVFTRHPAILANSFHLKEPPFYPLAGIIFRKGLRKGISKTPASFVA